MKLWAEFRISKPNKKPLFTILQNSSYMLSIERKNDDTKNGIIFLLLFLWFYIELLLIFVRNLGFFSITCVDDMGKACTNRYSMPLRVIIVAETQIKQHELLKWERMNLLWFARIKVHQIKTNAIFAVISSQFWKEFDTKLKPAILEMSLESTWYRFSIWSFHL